MSCSTIIPILFMAIGIGVFGLLIHTVNKDYARGIIPHRTAAILSAAFIGIILFLLFSIGTFIL